MPLPKLEGLIRFEETTEICECNSAPVSINAGQYFWNSYGPGGETPLLDVLAAAIGTAISDVVTATLDDDADSSTGKLTLASATPFNLDWTDLTIRDVLGYNDDNAAATSQLSDNHVRYLWLPNCGRAGAQAPSGSSTSQQGRQEVDGTFTMAPSGHSMRLVYAERSFDNLEFRHLTGRKAWLKFETYRNESFQRFWKDVVSQGRELRLHDDRSLSGYQQYVAEDYRMLALTAVKESWVDSPSSLWALKYFVRQEMA